MCDVVCVFVWLWLWWMVAHVEQVMDRSRTDETGDGGGYPFGRKCASIFQFWDDPLIMSSPFLFPLLETAAQERVATHQVTRAAVGPVWRGTGRSDCSMLTYCPDSIDGLHLAFYLAPTTPTPGRGARLPGLPKHQLHTQVGIEGSIQERRVLGKFCVPHSL